MSRISKHWLPSTPSISESSLILKDAITKTISNNEFKPSFRLLQDGKIPRLQHGLSALLTKPGNIKWTHEGFTKVKKVPNISEQQLTRIQSYTPPSEDSNLLKAMKPHHLFMGSTSTMTGILSQIYYLISKKRAVNTDNLSSDFDQKTKRFTQGASAPVTILMKKQKVGRNTAWSVDADKSFDRPNILSKLGHVMEYQLTQTSEAFEQLINNKEKAKRESFNLMDVNSMLVRSQLDCYHKNVDKGFFDLKTRAVLSIRLSVADHKANTWYKIVKKQGQFLSFEREYYDMIRSAFLKYYFQVCIGNMAGIFVAYHNTNEIFGFQYIPREELAYRVFGSSALGEAVFANCVQIAEVILKEMISDINTPQFTSTWYFDKEDLSIFRESVGMRYSRFDFKKLLRPEQNYNIDTLKMYTVSSNSLLNGEPFIKSNPVHEDVKVDDFVTNLSIIDNELPIVDIAAQYKKVKSLEHRVKTGNNSEAVVALKEQLESELLNHALNNKP